MEMTENTSTGNLPTIEPKQSRKAQAAARRLRDEQLEFLMWSLARGTQSAAMTAIGIKGRSFPHRKKKDADSKAGALGTTQEESQQDEKKTSSAGSPNIRTVSRKSTAAMSASMDAASRHLSSHFKLVPPAGIAARSALVRIANDDTLCIPAEPRDSLDSRVQSIEVMGRPIAGRQALQKGGADATVAALVAGPAGAFDLDPGLEWAGDILPEMLVLIHPASLESAVHGAIPKFQPGDPIRCRSPQPNNLAQQEASRSPSETRRLTRPEPRMGFWWDTYRHQASIAAGSRSVAGFEYVVSAKDDKRQLAQAISKSSTCGVVHSGSVIPPIIELLISQRPTRAFLGVTDSHTAVMLAAIARCYGGVLRACQVQRSNDLFSDEQPGWTARTAWLRGESFVKKDVLSIVTGISSSHPIAPINGSDPHSASITSWCAWSGTGERWLIERQMIKAKHSEVDRADAWNPHSFGDPFSGSTRRTRPGPIVRKDS